MVLPVDKGIASVVLNAAKYHGKLAALIVSCPKHLHNKDPTDRLTRIVSEKLLTLKRNGHMLQAVYNNSNHQHKQPPMIYGLPKIHKANTPLRSIVSCVNTFACDLSPLTGNRNFTGTNSAHFESTIDSEKI